MGAFLSTCVPIPPLLTSSWEYSLCYSVKKDRLRNYRSEYDKLFRILCPGYAPYGNCHSDYSFHLFATMIITKRIDFFLLRIVYNLAQGDEIYGCASNWKLHDDSGAATVIKCKGHTLPAFEQAGKIFVSDLQLLPFEKRHGIEITEYLDIMFGPNISNVSLFRNNKSGLESLGSCDIFSVDDSHWYQI